METICKETVNAANIRSMTARNRHHILTTVKSAGIFITLSGGSIAIHGKTEWRLILVKTILRKAADMQRDNSTAVLLPDLHDYEAVMDFAKLTVANFCKPKHFAGGRFQTRHPCIFVHVTENGRLGKVEINKPGGSRFYLKE